MYKSITAGTLFAIFLSGSLGATAGETTPTSLAGAKTITTQEAKQLFDQGAVFVDPRKDTDWNAGRIPEAVHLELNSNFTADNLAGVVKKDEPVVLYCNGVKCKVSYDASVKAIEWGFTNVNWYRGGLPEWKAAGYPVE